ncbi:MAG: zinc-ribbon domain-containing protein [Porcincola intestinalis]|jgi:uncharacterized membrane protein YvbJ|uniref:Zinc-ribbon domain-containing protein n=2 Tax=Porcincola intestinalis TaxID=2606632 RepID=A0A6L5X4G0_9FIRM|nr:zinc ribbon domain-containing protein [Porcincola intestinalis]MCI6237714.1 zinc-ribbon domain-containing protein [Lachnospiraceae bacterium]MCI7092315.1 zinc-ribbon domain-containing protein [Lachnospiraceae bacterium]MDY5331737.1 zinc-ribbon domain-containing protein [Porcincola intestinalis]MDY5580099.1 zinc-ribbon domain-containing protein [Porcincola intestinalis]MSS14515.1 zinc-ribbon domain-containing protein [Porcincola intestinalis]
MYCSNCGKPLPDGSRACPYCGAPSGGFAPFTAYQPNITEDNIPDEWKPISMWGYFGYEILFSIPLIGLILLIVFSVGGTKNRNLRNFARSYFCFLIVAIIVIAIILAVTSTSTFFTDILRA